MRPARQCAAGGGLQRGQPPPRVAGREPGQHLHRLRLHRDAGRTQAARVGDRTLEQRAHVGGLQLPQRHEQAARQQRRHDRERRVLGRRGDQGHPAVLDRRQQGVLLGLGEAVHLVDEQDRAAPGGAELAARVVDDRADVLDPCRHGGQLRRTAAPPRSRPGARASSCRCRAAPTGSATSAARRPRPAGAAATRAGSPRPARPPRRATLGRIRTASGATSPARSSAADVNRSCGSVTPATLRRGPVRRGRRRCLPRCAAAR